MGDKKGKKHLAKEDRQAKAKKVKTEKLVHDRHPHQTVENIISKGRN